MLKLLTPEYYEKSIYDIDYEKLKLKGIKFLIFDIDNTLVVWKSKSADEKVKKLMKELDEFGFRIGILSNSSSDRVMHFIDKMNITSYPYGRKPMKTGFNGMIKLLGANKNQTCIIGDQIFTDIFGGNRVGIHTLLVDPINKKEFITTRWLRKLDNKIRKKIANKGEVSKSE